MINYRRKFCFKRDPDPVDAGGGEADTGDSSAGSGAIGTGNDERLARLDAINDANDASNAEELADVNDDGTTTPFLVEGDAAEVVPEEVPPKEIAEPEADDEPVRKFKVKVNGKELEFTEEELIARAQKVASADEYLADAARQKREAAAQPAAPAGPTEAELQAARDAEDRAIVRAIQMGTEEEALQAVRKLDERRARPSVTTDDMSRAIDERLAFNEAISKFRSDYSDISGDPLLNTLAQQRDNELIASGDARPYAERYEQIGKELRAWKESLSPAPAKEPEVKEPVETGMEAKKAKKAAAPTVPVSATKKVQQVKPDEDDGEEDASSVIANIAKARGGPQWMKA